MGTVQFFDLSTELGEEPFSWQMGKGPSRLAPRLHAVVGSNLPSR
jgi:hypothetical protein